MRETYRSPLVLKQGYLAHIVHYDTGKKTAVYQHRELVEQALGRKLATNEVVHHRNHIKTDNRLENLEVLSPAQHRKAHEQDRQASKVDLPCSACGKVTSFLVSRIRRNQGALGQKGPFCSKACSGKYARSVQIEKSLSSPTTPAEWVHGNANTYSYRGCRCDLCRSAATKKVLKNRANRKKAL